MKSKNVFKRIKEFTLDEFRYLKDSIIAIRSNRDDKAFQKYTSKYIREFFETEKSSNKDDSLLRESILKNSEEFKIPIVMDEDFCRFLNKFMHSFRNKEHPTVNLNNLLFLSGPEKNGKSWFLRHNLKTFAEEESEKKTLVIHYDIGKILNQNFYSFLFNFEAEIVKAIVERNDYEINKHENELLSIEDLKDLLFFRWEKGWIEINLSKSLRRAVNEIENEAPYTFYIDRSKYRDEILDLYEKYERKAFKEYIFIEEMQRIVEMIADSMSITQLEAGLLLIQDLLIQREDFRKHSDNVTSNIHSGELYRDGLEVMEYFFDVLNHIAGYHEKQLQIQADEPLFIYPHVVLALENVNQIFDMKDAESRPMDYLHRIMLRLYNNSGYRNHFPVVLETNKNFYFDRTIYDEMWEMKYAFPSLVYLPVKFWNTIENHLDKIFNNYQREYTLSLLGDSSIYFYDAYVEAIKANDQRVKFPNTGTVLKNEYHKFLYKINRLYVNPRMALSLDKGTIDFEILDALIQWKKVFEKHYTPYIGMRRKAYDNLYLNQQVTKALFEENLTFFNKYFKRVHFEHFIYNTFNVMAIKSLYKNKINSLWRKLCFFYFRHNKAFVFSIDYYTIGKKKYSFSIFKDGWDYSSKDWIWGSNLKWDVPDELYKGHNVTDFTFRTFQKTGNIY